jgi:hypothetical protein
MGDEPSSKSDRYNGQPLLRLLESYVLWAIGELSDEDKALIERMVPHLQRTFGVRGTWQEILESVMELPTNMPSLIRRNWEENLAIAEERREELAPTLFAREFVDANLR